MPHAAARSAHSGHRRETAAGPQAVLRNDRLNLDTTVVTGNRELPKVLYIVPWRPPVTGDLVGRPVESLLDEALAPVDRDVFRRQVQYHSNVHSPQPAAGGR